MIVSPIENCWQLLLVHEVYQNEETLFFNDEASSVLYDQYLARCVDSWPQLFILLSSVVFLCTLLTMMLLVINNDDWIEENNNSSGAKFSSGRNKWFDIITSNYKTVWFMI